MAQDCEAETSLVLHFTPDLVDMSKAVRTVGETQPFLARPTSLVLL
jgi:creatinine amidohydrolase/Fe(II)-dependent formamide hydrolase-like protein